MKTAVATHEPDGTAITYAEAAGRIRRIFSTPAWLVAARAWCDIRTNGQR